jgi:hypothetical protein
MTFLWIAGVAVVLLLAWTFWMGMPKGPSLKEVSHRKDPRIVMMDPQKILLVRASGDPNEVGRRAFGLLFRTYYRLKGVPKGGPDFKPPRARWPVGQGVPMEEWEGLYAMPVPQEITSLPGARPGGGLGVELTVWDYGEVAEILHVGRYDQEEPTVKRLMAFLQEAGYEAAGMHEEEYLKGPGMLFSGNPARYLTVIRYPVRRRADTLDG